MALINWLDFPDQLLTSLFFWRSLVTFFKSSSTLSWNRCKITPQKIPKWKKILSNCSGQLFTVIKFSNDEDTKLTKAHCDGSGPFKICGLITWTLHTKAFLLVVVCFYRAVFTYACTTVSSCPRWTSHCTNTTVNNVTNEPMREDTVQ